MCPIYVHILYHMPTFFVTNNRRLTQMKIKDRIRFTSPKEFVEKVLRVKGVETKGGY